jgi:hypothetical protein
LDPKPMMFMSLPTRTIPINRLHVETVESTHGLGMCGVTHHASREFSVKSHRGNPTRSPHSSLGIFQQSAFILGDIPANRHVSPVGGRRSWAESLRVLHGVVNSLGNDDDLPSPVRVADGTIPSSSGIQPQCTAGHTLRT